MCGVAGAMVLEDRGFRVTADYLRRMRDVMRHRGPDGAGLWVAEDGRVGLAHRRLAIIDLSAAAAQPMSNEDGSVWVSYNGEIYNHAEIRRELEALGGHRWKTDHSDTEVIVHAYEQWGIDCLSKFRGMFAIALWDARRQHLWLVRDRIGIKPLYYSLHHGRLTFASEIKALLQDPQQPRAVNEVGLYHYLSFLTTPAPQTLFAGIHKLPPGTWMRVDRDGHIQERRYWDVWDHASPLENQDEGLIAERILSELRSAVQYRKESDVPVGVFLSGGIDSSANAALFSEQSTRPVKTFTIGYQGEHQSYQNECHFARQMAHQVGSEHHELLLGVDDLLGFLPRMVQLQDEPIGDPVCVPLYFVSKLARDHGVTVCQVGEGADELFWGYPTWKLKLRLQQAHDLIPVPGALKHAFLGVLRGAGKDQSHAYEALRRATHQLPVFWGGVDAFTEAQKRRLLSPAIRRRLGAISSWDALAPIHERFRASSWQQSTLHWMSYVDLSLRLPELLLMRVDKMSMGVSLEGRVPFLDHKLVELAMSIGQATKTRHGTLKHILKKSVRGIVPPELIERKKQGFGVPVYEWVLDKLGVYMQQQLSDFCRRTDYFDHDAVMQLIHNRQGPSAWYLLNFALWWKEYIAQDATSERIAA